MVFLRLLNMPKYIHMSDMYTNYLYIFLLNDSNDFFDRKHF